MSAFPRTRSRPTASSLVWSLALCVMLLAGCSSAGGTPTGSGAASGAAPAAAPPATSPPNSASAPAPSAAAPAGLSGAPRSIKVAHAFISAETLPIWAGQELGLFEKYGLKVEALPLQTSAQVAPAMASGDVQLALTTGSGVVEFDLSGGDHVIVAGYSDDMRYFLHARPEIRRVEDLRDKRIGITRRGGAIDVAAHLLLEKHGMTYGRDVAIIELGTAQNQIGGLSAGAVDAVIVALPTNFLAEREGYPLIEDTKQHGIKFPTNVIAVRQQYLASNADVVRAYLQGHIEAVEVLRRDRALAKRLLAKGTSSDDEDLLEKSYQIWIQDLQTVPYPSPAAIQGALDAVVTEKPEARNAKPSDYYDDRLVRELDQSGFIQRVRGS